MPPIKVQRWRRQLRLMLGYWCALLLLLTTGHVCLAQNPQDETPLAKQRASELMEDLPAQIKKLDDPTARVFLQLQLATFYWSDLSEQSQERARALTLSGLQ